MQRIYLSFLSFFFFLVDISFLSPVLAILPLCCKFTLYILSIIEVNLKGILCQVNFLNNCRPVIISTRVVERKA